MSKRYFKAVMGFTIALSAISSNAQVVARGDGTFEDVANGLIWTNGNISSGTLKSFSDASSWAANLALAGVTSWQLPTRAQFALLYATQGNSQSGGMVRAPLTIGGNYYWTSDVGSLPAPNSTLLAHFAFAPNGSPIASTFTVYADTVSMDFWAVSSVPEPAILILASLGVAALGVVRRLRQV